MTREVLTAAMQGSLSAEVARLRGALRRRPTAKTIADMELAYMAMEKIYIKLLKENTELKRPLALHNEAPEPKGRGKR